ncbi:endo-beta-N-acetylglucosaminidase, partial [Nocardiopsis composta]
AAARPGQSAPAGAFRPEAAYWFPDSVPDGEPGEGVVWRSLLDYAPEDDPDLPYNAATVPLAERVAPVPAHPGAPADGARVQSLVSFAPTAGHPAQGGPGARHYAFTHWAYLEELVFWGGSSAEGLILAPTAPVVDAAHRNGVPVLGTVFLPPRTYGGDLQWTRDLVRRDEGGEYPVAAKLAEVADAYGFDGWFVNAETEGGDSALADAVRGFLKRLRTLSGKRITWYDAMTTSGAIDWRNRLDEANEPFFHDADGPVAHTMFVNFDWTAEGLAASAERARELGRDPHRLWAGIDVEARGPGTPVDWAALFGADPAGAVSIGLYRPEWTHTSLPEDAGPEEFHRREEGFWTGPAGRPAPAGEGEWPGIAAHAPDRCAAAELPFGTVFNAGHGTRYAVQGRTASTEAWHHLGVQDVLPPRRWVRRGGGERPPGVALDFTEPFHGGSCLHVRGLGPEAAEIDLYPARLDTAGLDGAAVELIHRGEGVRVELAAAWAEPGAPGEAPPYTHLTAPEGAEPVPGTPWKRSVFPLPAGEEGPLRALGVRLRAEEDGTEWRLGRLVVGRPGGPPPARPGRPRIEAAHTSEDGGTALRVRWNPAEGARHYELFQVTGEGAVLLGATASTAFHAHPVRRLPGEDAARLEIRAVGRDYARSAPAELQHPW